MDRRNLIAYAAAITGMASGLAPAWAADGPLRAVYLSGNPVQASPDPTSGALKGPAVDLAREIARRLGRTLELSAGNGVDGVLASVRDGRADIGFVAYDPTRADGLEFSPPYLLSLNGYVVLSTSPLRELGAVDTAGIVVGVNPGDSGGLYLKRTLKAAMLHPVSSPDMGRDLLLASTINAFAANRQRLNDVFAGDPRFRILPGSFFDVPQTVAVKKSDDKLGRLVSDTVRELLRTGFVQRAITDAGLVGARAAALDEAANQGGK
jgi:polar amino acid transport system substrate-binding protein